MKNIKFAEIVSEEIYDSLLTSRYSVFVEELNRTYPSQYIQQRKLIEPIDKISKNYVLIKDEQIIGGIRSTVINKYSEFPIEFLDHYHIGKEQLGISIYLSKLFIIPPNNRNKRYLPYFLANLFVSFKRMNIKFLYLNTNEELLKLYEKLGFQKLSNNFYLDEVRKEVFPMVAILDEDYLNRCNSISFKNYIKEITKDSGNEL